MNLPKIKSILKSHFTVTYTRAVSLRSGSGKNRKVEQRIYASSEDKLFQLECIGKPEQLTSLKFTVYVGSEEMRNRNLKAVKALLPGSGEWIEEMVQKLPLDQERTEGNVRVHMADLAGLVVAFIEVTL